MVDERYNHTVSGVMDAARAWGGAVHGDDADGWTDVEWPTVMDAAPFLTYVTGRRWPVKFRDVVASPTRTVVVQVWAPPLAASEFDRLTDDDMWAGWPPAEPVDDTPDA